MRKITPYNGYYYTVEFSPDESGYYCEIFDADGHDIGQTALHDTNIKAREAARNLIDALQD